MEDWQGCLSPLCQSALQAARDHVARRGGYAITVEDFLLELLDADAQLCAFLQGRGVDLDELIRTIQCEQPIVTEVGGDGHLSSQLQDWFATARQVHNLPWLDWPHLLQVLTSDLDRLSGKAYVAVLELVGQWPLSAGGRGEIPLSGTGHVPVVVADPGWAALAEDVAVALSCPGALVWVRGPRGSGKSCWLRSVLPGLLYGHVVMDLRSETEVLANDQPCLPEPGADPAQRPVLVLDNMPPADLLALMNQPSGLASGLVPAWPGSILLLGPAPDDTGAATRELESRLGRAVDLVDMPLPGNDQRLAILVAHQPILEKRWNVEIPETVLRYAAVYRDPALVLPGQLIHWVERSCVRLAMHAQRGSSRQQALRAQLDTLRRQFLVAVARQENHDVLAEAIRELEARLADLGAQWEQRRQSGNLRRLQVQDLQEEQRRWLAAEAAPVNNGRQTEPHTGDTTLAGSGNLYS
ncbi:MAG: hypothetical protein SVX28_00935 [Pseudomonadota bacterium]|nr:hypothetical protein [Pseudomonadota bacterium]